MAEVVLDASALLAWLNDEPGAAAVEAVLADAVISSVNLSEVGAVLADVGMPPEEVGAVFSDLELRTVPFDDDLALLAASLRPATRSAGLSLGDRACLALAQRLDAPAITGDRAWARVDVPVAIRLIR